MDSLLVPIAVVAVAALVLLIMPGWKSALALFLVYAGLLAWLGWPSPGTASGIGTIAAIAAGVLMAVLVVKLLLLRKRQPVSGPVSPISRRLHGWRPPNVGED